MSLVFPPSKVGGCFQKDPELWPPLGLGYIAAVLQKEGYTVDIIDSTILTKKEYETKIENLSADMVGISASFGQLEATRRLARDLESRSIPVVVGGPGPSSVDASFFLDACTCVVFGEGEETVVEVVHNIEDGHPLTVKGTATSVEGNVVHHGQRPCIKDLDRLPFPARELYPATAYLNQWKKAFPHAVTSAISSRGCPFHCIFCSKSVFGKKFRGRSAENLGEEMRLIEEMGFDRIWFTDDLFIYNKKRVRQICETIKKEKIDLEWACQARIELVDEELLSLMKDSGLICIAFGVESGSQRVVDWFKKGFSISQCKKVFTLCHTLDIAVHAYFIVGAPVETEEDVRKTKKLINEINPAYAVFSVLTPYPGTPLYDLYTPSSCDFDEFNDAQRSVIAGQERAEEVRKEMEEFYFGFKREIGEEPLLLGEI